jgi:hypothetical protein
MASLDIEPRGGGNYLFTAEGCHLKYFVIWAEGEEPRWEPVYGDGYYYQMSYNLDRNRRYNFHVYDGNESKDFRGKMVYRT